MQVGWGSYADGGGVGDALGKILCLLQSSACYCDLDARLCEDIYGWSCAAIVSGITVTNLIDHLHETSTEQESRPDQRLANFHNDSRACTYFPLYAPVAAAAGALALIISWNLSIQISDIP
jgi:hypothetical protein